MGLGHSLLVLLSFGLASMHSNRNQMRAPVKRHSRSTATIRALYVANTLLAG